MMEECEDQNGEVDECVKKRKMLAKQRKCQNSNIFEFENTENRTKI